MSDGGDPDTDGGDHGDDVRRRRPRYRRRRPRRRCQTAETPIQTEETTETILPLGHSHGAGRQLMPAGPPARLYCTELTDRFGHSLISHIALDELRILDQVEELRGCDKRLAACMLNRLGDLQL